MSKFFVVSTPIGNLGDITLRAIETLKSVDIVFCEDTRQTKKLFEKYEIKTPMMSYHAQSGESKTEKIIEFLKEGKNLALVSDAGTPGISDPGAILVSKIREKFSCNNITNSAMAESVIENLNKIVDLVPIPGPTALISALSVSGLPTHEFTFLGFLPHKKGRETLFKEIAESKRTMVFYESPHRILKTLESLVKFCPDKKICIAREITKIHEEFKTGNPSEILKYFLENTEKQRGEFTVIVS